MIKAIITPIHRPEDMKNAHENAMRQGSEWTWIVIEDHGKNLARDTKPSVHLHSGPHVSHARNAALEYLRQQPGGPHLWVNFDADDYYSQGYANKKAFALQKFGQRLADISTSSDLFVHLTSGELLRCPTPGPMGSTLAGWSDCENYPLGPNEDGAWFELMRKRDALDSQIDAVGHIYQRTERGVWKVSDQEILAAFRLRALNAPMWTYGKCSAIQAQSIAEGYETKRTSVPLSVVFA